MQNEFLFYSAILLIGLAISCGLMCFVIHLTNQYADLNEND
nr:MAG TPA: hypothetical protein [Caudoviricetes sp.]